MVTSVQKNKFKIILTNQKQEKIDIDYLLDDSLLATKWSGTIKHLQQVPYDPVESGIEDVSDLKTIYRQFCHFANLEPIDTNNFNQNVLNELHKIYEEHHDRLSKEKNNSVLYRFHHSIHSNEEPNNITNTLKVGWGIKEGPLTQQYDCHSHYTDSMKQNQIYLPWAELGKKPLDYYKDNEPNNQQRFNELSKPHMTFRPKFIINLEDCVPQEFDPDFVDWFATYKESWLEAHGINDYEAKHHYSAPVLAHTDCKESLQGYKFQKIIV